MDNMYEILSDNLARLRKSRNLTQAEFAEIIKYSDKSVSKWETGMSVPNLETLIDIADFYQMSLDDLVRKPIDNEKVLIVEKIKKNNQFTIMLLAISAIFLLATVIFCTSIIIKKDTSAWKAFIWALPLSFTITTIFSALWNKKYLYVSLSCLLWTLITAIYLQTLPQNYFLLFVVGCPIQIIIFLCRGFKRDLMLNEAERLVEILKRRAERQKMRKLKRELRKEKNKNNNTYKSKENNEQGDK